jgi:preprotein translocase subunit SecA
MVEQAQERVEGNNFDVRKHLLEYDDVLNSQRKRIYGERNRAFEKEDLHEDILDILRTELNERIPKAFNDDEGPWKLLAYLEEVQPSMTFETEGIRAPSYTLKLIYDEFTRRLGSSQDDEKIKEVLLELAAESISAENDHILNSTRLLMEKTEETIDQIRNERLESLDIFFDGIETAQGEEGVPQRRPQEMLDELVNLVRTPLRLTSEELRALPDADANVKSRIADQIQQALNFLAISRTIGAIERRLDESLNMKAVDLQDLDWPEVAGGIQTQIERTLKNRFETLTSAQGQLNQNIENVLSRTSSGDTGENRLIDLLVNMSTGTKLAIDPRTHQRGMRRVILVNYIFKAARLIQDEQAASVTNDVLEHLELIQQKLETVWGKMEFERFRLSGNPLQNLEPVVRESVATELGESEYSRLKTGQLDELTPEQCEIVEIILGRRVQNQIHRHILLSVISELWVDYLTKVDSLRVSIGLEAFAQRDPLVQYKGKASEMFKELLSDIRAGVIGRMFLFQPRRPGSQSIERPVSTSSVPVAAAQPSAALESGKKKRKRH